VQKRSSSKTFYDAAKSATGVPDWAILFKPGDNDDENEAAD
jgi:hypothetical protein